MDATEQESSKPTNWYSGWRLVATSAATVLAVKLIGLLGAFIAGLVFYWLRPKRGTGQAAVASVVAGVVVALVYSAVLLPTLYPPQAQPAAQVAPEQIDWEKGALTAPAPTAQGEWIPAPPNLKPFHGKLDGEK